MKNVHMSTFNFCSAVFCNCIRVLLSLLHANYDGTSYAYSILHLSILIHTTDDGKLAQVTPVLVC